MRVAARQLALGGYAKTTMRSIADEAGYAVGAVTYHFPTKVDLVSAVIDEIDRAALPGLEAVLARPTLAERVETMLVSLTVGGPQVLGGVGSFLVVDGRRHPEIRPLIDASIARHEAVLRRMVDDAVRTGEVRADTDRQGVVDALRALMFGRSALFGDLPETRIRAAARAALALAPDRP